MNWNELQAEAKKITENVPSGDFFDKSFSCRSGGAPTNKISLPEISRSSEFAYSTVRNGGAYTGEVVIRCRETGAKDRNNRVIYECENGMLFVYRYSSGSAYDFDSGRFELPDMNAR